MEISASIVAFSSREFVNLHTLRQTNYVKRPAVCNVSLDGECTVLLHL